MKKIIARFISFFLDLMLVTLLISSISNLSIFDKYNSNIELTKQEAAETNAKYTKLTKEIDDILEDALVDEEEFNYIHTNFFEFRKAFDEIRAEENVPKKIIDNIHDGIDNAYQDIYNDQLYSIAINTRYQNVIAIVIYILYFGIVQYIMKGQTVFKKIFKIKVVDKKDINKRVPLWKFILRTILVCDIIFTTVDIIAVSKLSLSSYIPVNIVIGNIRFFYEVIFIIFMILRDDQRSVHDLLLNTKIIRYNRYGKVQNDILFKMEEPEKTSTKEKKVREEVKAEKVND